MELQGLPGHGYRWKPCHCLKDLYTLLRQYLNLDLLKGRPSKT